MFVNLYFVDKYVVYKIVGIIIMYGDCNFNIIYVFIE